MKALLKLKLRLMKDNKTLYVIMIAMSLILSAVFGNSMTGSYQPTIVVVDEDQSIEASDLIAKLSSEYNFNVKLKSYDEAMDDVMNRNALSTVVIKENFYEIKSGIEVIQLRETVESFQLSNLLENEVNLIKNMKQLTDKTIALVNAQGTEFDQNKLSADIKTVFVEQWETKKPIRMVSEIFSTNEAKFSGLNIHYIVGMTLFFVTYSLMFTVGDILEDKRLHTLDRMMVSPSTRMDVLWSNLISAMVIGTLQIIVMVFAGQFLFGIDWGNNLLLVIGLGVLYIFVMTALSLFVVSLMKTMAQLSAVSPIVLTGMGMLGGCMWPLEIITSKPLLMLANITPHKWAISAIEGVVIHGKVDSSTLISVVVLLSMGIGYLILGERVLYLKSLKDN
ncbi:ABC transporter permease [Fusibacter bizertensis]|uniref:ABC transporter permease n=1 Tax=Fusibacter bizertensis TaxID=1488331 RepID=A0ABT6NBW8_9FIRM|nr:ABC transporter permease [Fusibacter bizertensis]MDH8677903.1 ABC transporter permease [Fusibacter bizertensis]